MFIDFARSPGDYVMSRDVIVGETYDTCYPLARGMLDRIIEACESYEQD